MVQYINGSEWPHQKYWKLQCWEMKLPTIRAMKKELTRRNYPFVSSANKERLHRTVSRAISGFLSYDGCTTQELASFCTQRSLQINGKPTRKNLIDRLEQEDEIATFDRFLDLPPELRNKIYSIHLETITQGYALEKPIPPPITSVSRQIRSETLLLFHQICKTVLHFGIPNVQHSHGYRLLHPTRVFARSYTKQLFTRAPLTCLGNLKKLRIDGLVFPAGRWIRTGWNVDLGNGNVPVSISRGIPMAPSSLISGGFREACEKMEAKLRTRLEAIVAREGNETFRRGDLESLALLFKPEDED